MRVHSEWDEDHVLVVEFTNDAVAMDERRRWGGWLVCAPKFGPFMTLKIVVCIGSDGFEDVFGDDGLGR
jgi:hypothetical protein